MTIGIVIAVMVIVGVTVGVLGGDPAGTASVATGVAPSAPGTIPSGWVVFEGESISLALPEYFRGGTPDAPGTIAVVRQLIKTYPELSELETVLADPGGRLVMVGEPSEDEPLLFVVMAGVNAISAAKSLEEAVNDHVRDVQAASSADSSVTVSAEVESVTESTAILITRWTVADGRENGGAVQYSAIWRVGTRAYTVTFQTDGETESLLEPIFRASIKTVVVKDSTP
jgi:hypothetical protein